MSINRWRGDYLPRAQVVTLTVGSATVGHTFVVTMNGKAVSYTAITGDTTATIATALQALLAGATAIPEFAEVTWAVDATNTNVVVGTAATPGVPFTASLSGTGTFTLATPTTSTGPNHVDEPKNWSLGTVPGATDDVLVDGGADLLFGWNNLSAAAYASLRVKASFGGAIGLPFYNPAGYVEYRTRAWPVNTAVPVLIGEGTGQGPSRVVLACGAALDLTVFQTQGRAAGAEGDTGPVVNVSGPTSGTCYIAAGDVGFAADDDTLTASGVTVTMDGDSPVLTVGRNATVATLNQSGGATTALGVVTTANVTGGTLVLYRAPTTLTADAGGTVDCRFTGTATTVTFRGQGAGADAAGGPVCECGNDPRPRTFTNSTFVGGAVLHDPEKTATFTNSGTWDRASLAASDLGARFSLQRT